MTRVFLHTILFISLMLLFSFGVTAQEPATPEAKAVVAAGSVYKASDIESFRALAVQVNWKDGAVDEAFEQPTGRFTSVWAAALKAAVLGGAERLQAALGLFDRPLSDDSVDQPEPTEVAKLIESFDLLQATTEWKAQSQTDRDAFIEKLEEYLGKVFFDANAISIKSNYIPREWGEMAQWKTLQIYWGALTHSEKWVQNGWKHPLGYSFIQNINHHITGEGFFGATVDEHTTTASICLAAGAALRSASPDAYIELKPYLQAMLDVSTELVTATGDWPMMMQRGETNNMQPVQLFERGYRLFGNQRCAALLNRIYQDAPRKVEHAVIGGPTLLNILEDAHTSALMPQTGAVWMRSANSPVSVFLDTGGSRFGDQAGLLSLSVHHHDKQWTNDNAGFSGVVIDGEEQAQIDKELQLDELPKNALVMNMRETSNGGVYVSSTATGQFTERPAYTDEQVAGFGNGTYQRALYLVDNLLVDLFWVRGGGQQDYQYRVNGAWQENGPNSFTATSGETTERLTSVNPGGLQFSPGGDGLFQAKFTGEGNLFAFVHEFVEGEVKPASVKLLPLDPAPNARNFQAIAFAVERGERTDLFFAALSREIEYRGEYDGEPFTFQGDFGHMQLKGATMESLFLTGGSTLNYDQYGAALNQAMQYGGLSEISASESMARTIMPESVPVHGLYSILALDMDSQHVMYQPFWIKAAGYEHQPNRPQRLQLLQPSVVDNPRLDLGVQLRPGCKTVFHHTLSMKLIEQTNDYFANPLLGGRQQQGYQVVTSAPVRLRVPVWNNLKKVRLVESTVIERRRGEEMNGVVEVSLLPTETKDGRATFVYSP